MNPVVSPSTVDRMDQAEPRLMESNVSSLNVAPGSQQDAMVEIKCPFAHTCTSATEIDRRRPLNWSKQRKARMVMLICANYFMFTFITTIPAITSVTTALQTKYGASYAQVGEYGVAMPALSLAISPLFWTPLAKTFGRRPTMILGVFIAFLASVGCAVTETYAGYMVSRFLQGWGVGPASTVGLQVLEELYCEQERGEKIGYWTLSIDIGLLFGPLIGGVVALVSAEFVFWFSGIIFGILFIGMLLFFDETAYPLPQLSPSQQSSSSTVVEDVLPWLNLYRTNVHGLVRTPIWETLLDVIRTSLYPNVAIPIISFCWTWYLWIMCVIVMLPIAYPNWSPAKQGLSLIGMIIGTVLAETTFSGAFSDRFTSRLSGGDYHNREPEMRLWLFIPAALTTASGLLLFGLSQQFTWHWSVTQLATAIFAFGVQVGNTTTTIYVVECYPAELMSIVAFYSLHLNLSAFASPFWILPMTNTLGWAWSFGSQAIAVVVFATAFVTPLILWGKRMRVWRGPLSSLVTS